MLSGTLSESHTVWTQIRADIMLIRIWVQLQTVCKGYQQMARVTAGNQRVKYRTSLSQLMKFWYLWHYVNRPRVNRLRQTCANAQSHQALHCSHIQSRGIDEVSGQTLATCQSI